MKILMMSNTYFPVVGGIENSIRFFSEEFRRLGHEVMIAAPSCEGEANDEKYVIRLPAIKKFYHTEFSVNVPVPGLIPKLIKTFYPDIVHSHHPFFLGDVALRLSRQYHIPLVFTYHIMFEKYVHYLPVHNEKAKRFVIELAAGYSNLAHQVIAPSASVRDLLIKRGVTTPIEVIPTGINLELFCKGDGNKFRIRNGIPSDAFVIGHVGRLAQEKNMEFLVRSLVALLKTTPTAHVLMAGHGPSETMIEDLFRKAGLQARLHLKGFLYNQDLIDAYWAMDVFAFASLSETQGMVLVEAMAAGVPVVAVDATGVREVVKDYSNGRLVAQPDEHLFVEALQWSLNCPSRIWQKIKQQAGKTARQYSIQTCAKRMVDIYQHVQAKELTHSETESSWHMLRERMKAEWDIFKNLLEASEAAVFEKSFKEKQGDKCYRD